MPYVVKYLKGCSVLLMQAISGQRLSDPRQLGCAIGRTKSGVPSIIPAVHRKAIRTGDGKALRIWLSFFALYRVLNFPGKLKLSTITAPGPKISSRFMRSWKQHCMKLWAYKGYNPDGSSLTVRLEEADAFAIPKSSPTTSEALTGIRSLVSTSTVSVLTSALAIAQSRVHGHSGIFDP